MSIFEFINFFVSINLILTGILLLLVRKTRSLFLIMWSILYIEAGLNILLMTLYQRPPSFLMKISGIEYIFGLSQGPIYVILSKIVVEKKSQITFSDLIYFSFPIVMVFIFVFLVFNPSPHQQFYKNITSGGNEFVGFIESVVFLSMFSAVIYGVVKLNKARLEMRLFYSHMEIVRINWLFIFFLVMLLSTPIGVLIFFEKISYGSIKLIGIWNFLMYSFFTYKLLKEPRLLYHSDKVASTESNNPRISKYRNDQSSDNEIIEKFDSLILTNRIFLSKHIDLEEICKQIKISPESIKTILKLHKNKSFHDYINSFRLENAKKMLIGSEFQKYKIDTIADLSGFSSRTIFYDLFRKEFNLTPLQFRKQKNPNSDENLSEKQIPDK
jgi:AraC-like DNA-binding protein